MWPAIRPHEVLAARTKNGLLYAEGTPLDPMKTVWRRTHHDVKEYYVYEPHAVCFDEDSVVDLKALPEDKDIYEQTDIIIPGVILQNERDEGSRATASGWHRIFSVEDGEILIAYTLPFKVPGLSQIESSS